MRLVLANASYRKHRITGGNAHIKQFIANAAALRHEVWTWPGDEHPASRRLPAGRIQRLWALRRAGVLYVRLEWSPPKAARWSLPPYRQLIGSPAVVWEFNTVPEYGHLIGRPQAEVLSAIRDFRRYGRGCDLAICVSRAIADYVRDVLGISRTATVPNGSDVDLFRPDVSPLAGLQRNSDRLNVVWIGSARVPWHNFDLLRDAAELIRAKGEQSRVIFHLIGPGFEESLRDMPAGIHYYGPRDYETIPHWLAGMDVGLCLYHPGPADFNSPLKLYDYMASGLTVVATGQPQVREVFDQLGQPDLAVPPDAPEALADVLLGLAADRDRVCRQGEAGRRLAVSFYNWRRAVRDTMKEIESVLRQRQPPNGSRA